MASWPLLLLFRLPASALNLSKAEVFIFGFSSTPFPHQKRGRALKILHNLTKPPPPGRGFICQGRGSAHSTSPPRARRCAEKGKTATSNLPRSVASALLCALGGESPALVAVNGSGDSRSEFRLQAVFHHRPRKRGTPNPQPSATPRFSLFPSTVYCHLLYYLAPAPRPQKRYSLVKEPPPSCG
jgi:hypothetical protein